MSPEAAITLTSDPGRSGRGIRIAIVDSGVHAGHPHVGGIAGGTAFGDNGEEHDDFVDRLGHGTAVAAAIREKAVDADLFAVKVFDRALSTSIASLVDGIDWAAHHGMHLVNLSLGTPRREQQAKQHRKKSTCSKIVSTWHCCRVRQGSPP